MTWERKQLRQAAQEIFASALHAVDARAAIRHALNRQGATLKILNDDFDLNLQPVYSIAIGKAAMAMAAGLSEIIDDKLEQGVLSGVVQTSASLPDLKKWQIFLGGHPLPNQQSLDAARSALELLDRADRERALVIFLISGGGSAMFEWPRSPEITLEDLREANRQLTSCGASIAEINLVRAAFSAVKGGGLAARAPNATQVTLIVSDTNPRDEAAVASGPTFAVSYDRTRAAEVVSRYGLDRSLPASIKKSIEDFAAGKSGLVGTIGRHHVILDNGTALNGAAAKARELGFTTEVATDIREQPIVEGCRLLLERLEELNGKVSGPVCLISGGEFSCPVREKGVGGRNLETVLRCALKISEHDLKGAVVLSAGTDGIDGNSPVAGAVADEETIERGKKLGLNAQRFLDESDAFSFFQSLGDEIMTGPTGTNVRDIRILLRGKPATDEHG
jgi:hydroxypyruvate reductase